MSLKAFIFLYCLLSHLKKSSSLFRFHRLRYKAKCSAALSDLSPQNHTQTFSDNTCLMKREWLDYILVWSKVLRCRMLTVIFSELQLSLVKHCS